VMALAGHDCNTPGYRFGPLGVIHNSGVMLDPHPSCLLGLPYAIATLSRQRLSFAWTDIWILLNWQFRPP
jgi:hypothetical protein